MYSNLARRWGEGSSLDPGQSLGVLDWCVQCIGRDCSTTASLVNGSSENFHCDFSPKIWNGLGLQSKGKHCLDCPSECTAEWCSTRGAEPGQAAGPSRSRNLVLTVARKLGTGRVSKVRNDPIALRPDGGLAWERPSLHLGLAPLTCARAWRRVTMPRPTKL